MRCQKKETWREGGGRGGDRYPLAVAIDRALVFPLVRPQPEGERQR